VKNGQFLADSASIPGMNRRMAAKYSGYFNQRINLFLCDFMQ
jgi:hypothetical protein